MNAWHRRPFLAFDTETSGTDPEADRIVTATVCHIDGTNVTTKTFLIAVDVDIPEAATAVHGVTTEHARTHGLPAAEAIAEIADAISSASDHDMPVVAYNAAFDFTMLDREAKRHGIGWALPWVIDPFVIWKHVDKYRRGKRTLEAACEAYGVRLDGAHDATEDALAAARVAWVMAERLPELLVPLSDLHDSQQMWKYEQAESFGAYLASQGKTDDVSREWPVVSAAAEGVLA